MNINDSRKAIDDLDRRIVELLNERARHAQAIGRTKAEQSAEAFAPAREQQVFDRLADANDGPLSDASLRAIYREVISACRALERRMAVGYWGPAGSNTHVAALSRFGHGVQLIPLESIAAVFGEVEKGGADYGVVPVENSTEGIVSYTFDEFLDSDLRVCAEVHLPIHHSIVSTAASLAEVRRLYTMFQATAQCRSWLSRHLPQVELIEVSTTARAAQVAAGEPDAAAIANRVAAEEYGLQILAEGIEDSARNFTRFFVLGRTQPPPTGHDKTSILFSVPHAAGALIRALAAFEKNNLNLTMIQSRPTKLKPWEYVFFVDVVGHVEEPGDSPLRRALQSFQERCLFIRVLGSYPEAEEASGTSSRQATATGGGSS
jgi:chorismate mutase/prephenate dehydratase